MRNQIIVGNWKMNKNNAETKAFFEEVDAKALSDKGLYGVGVPFTDLRTALDEAKNLIVAAENVHFEDSGAFTGEVSVPMLEELGVKYCIIGHSERRQMFGDTDETVNKKAKRLLAAGITPILCIGETEEEYDNGKTKDVITAQLQGSLKDIAAEEYANIVLAYEPIWAIGTGKSQKAAANSFVTLYAKSLATTLLKKFAFSTAEALNPTTSLNTWLSPISMVL